MKRRPIVLPVLCFLVSCAGFCRVLWEGTTYDRLIGWLAIVLITAAWVDLARRIEGRE